MNLFLILITNDLINASLFADTALFTHIPCVAIQLLKKIKLKWLVFYFSLHAQRRKYILDVFKILPSIERKYKELIS
jgi:hypothetical protein